MNNGYHEKPNPIGVKIRNERLELHLSIKKFGELLGLTDEAIIYWENNRGKPNIYSYQKLIEILGLLPFDVNMSTIGEKIKFY